MKLYKYDGGYAGGIVVVADNREHLRSILEEKGIADWYCNRSCEELKVDGFSEIDIVSGLCIKFSGDL